jgi:hypothetical protein
MHAPLILEVPAVLCAPCPEWALQYRSLRLEPGYFLFTFESFVRPKEQAINMTEMLDRAVRMDTRAVAEHAVLLRENQTRIPREYEGGALLFPRTTVYNRRYTRSVSALRYYGSEWEFIWHSGGFTSADRIVGVRPA